MSAKTEKSLSEQFVNLLQVPSEVRPNFAGDTGIEPVKGSRVAYLPMQIELLKPKIGIDLEALQTANLNLASMAQKNNYVGSDMVTSDNLIDVAENYLTTFDTLDFVPPLSFYINPSDLTRTFTKRSNSQFGGNGHIIEHWGNDQDKLSANGKLGAFYTSKTGLSRYFRRDSASFQQLMHLYLIYRNNGYIFESLDPRRIALVGRVQITFDTETWVGHFDSFSMTENADNPYTMDYAFEFTVREYYNDESLR